MSLPQASALASRSVRVPVTSNATPLGWSDSPITSHSGNQDVEAQLAPSVHVGQSPRTLGESVSSTLVFKRSNGVTGSLRRRKAPPAHNISEAPDANNASEEEMERIIDDGRSSPLARPLTPKQRLLQVKRSLKMAQVFGQHPPPSLYQNNVHLTFDTDVETHSDDDSVPPPKDDFASESDPGDPSDYTVGEDDEDVASGFGKIRPVPKPLVLRKRSLVQSTYPYLPTLPDIIPLSPLKDPPFGQYPSRLISPTDLRQGTTSPRLVRPLPDPPNSPRWTPEDGVFSIAKQRRASISGIDIIRESQHSQPSHSQRSSRLGSHSASTSISSTVSASTSVSDDPSFQARRKRAAKLARFFGVDYKDLHAVDTNPLARPSSEHSYDASLSTGDWSGPKAGPTGTQRGDEPVIPVPQRCRRLYRSQSRAQRSISSKLPILTVEENKAAKEKVTKGVRVINPRDNPQDVGEILVRLRAMR